MVLYVLSFVCLSVCPFPCIRKYVSTPQCNGGGGGCLRKGAREAKRSGSQINPVSLQAGEERREADRGGTGQRRGDSRDHEVGSWKLMGSRSLQGNDATRTVTTEERVRRRLFPTDGRGQKGPRRNGTVTPQAGDSWEPLALLGLWGERERTWGDRCVERAPRQEHRQTMVPGERAGMAQGTKVLSDSLLPFPPLVHVSQGLNPPRCPFK